MLQIPVGAQLTFIRDGSVVCEVADADNHVRYQGELTTLSALGGRLLASPDNPAPSVQGPLYFVYDGEVLSDRRLRLEREAGGEE